MRRSTNWLWRILGTVSLACLILLAAGFGWALKDHWAPSGGLAISKASPPPPAESGSLAAKSEWKIVALGDSLTVGTGDSTGSGYVRRAAEQLAETYDKNVHITNNLAIGGLRADELLERFNERGYVNAITQADLVFFTIGGNDLFQFASGGGSLADSGDISPEQLREHLPIGQQRLQRVTEQIRKLNPSVRIVYVGLYNPLYDVPMMRVEASRIVREWNNFASDLALQDGNMTVVPTYDLFEASGSRYLSSDHFHPNDEGYASIAQRIVQAIG